MLLSDQKQAQTKVGIQITHSVPAFGKQHYRQRPKNYTQVEERRHIVDIKKVENDHVVKIDGRASSDLPEAGAAR